VRLDTDPIVYELEDLTGEDVEGTFYKEQLQKTQQEIYRVDRVLRKRGNEVLVKWSGYPDKFNSWCLPVQFYRVVKILKISSSGYGKRMYEKDMRKGYAKRICEKDMRKGYAKRICEKDMRKGYIQLQM